MIFTPVTMLSRLALLLLLTSAVSAGPESTMRLVFEDQFNGDQIDKAKWNFNPAVVTLGTSPDGTNKATVVNLNIVSRGKPTLWSGSGMDCKFRQPYGYYEARMRMVQTGGHGCGMGFDIGAPAGKRFPSLSTGFGSGGGDGVGLSFAETTEMGGRRYNPSPNPVNMEGGVAYKRFNTYGVLFTDKVLSWYINGRQIFRSDRSKSGGVPGQNVAMHFRHSLPEGGVLKSFPDPTQGPEPFQIDWVKIYKP